MTKLTIEEIVAEVNSGVTVLDLSVTLLANHFFLFTLKIT